MVPIFKMAAISNKNSEKITFCTVKEFFLYIAYVKVYYLKLKEVKDVCASFICAHFCAYNYENYVALRPVTATSAFTKCCTKCICRYTFASFSAPFSTLHPHLQKQALQELSMTTVNKYSNHT